MRQGPFRVGYRSPPPRSVAWGGIDGGRDSWNLHQSWSRVSSAWNDGRHSPRIGTSDFLEILGLACSWTLYITEWPYNSPYSNMSAFECDSRYRYILTWYANTYLYHIHQNRWIVLLTPLIIFRHQRQKTSPCTLLFRLKDEWIEDTRGIPRSP